MMVIYGGKVLETAMLMRSNQATSSLYAALESLRSRMTGQWACSPRSKARRRRSVTCHRDARLRRAAR